MNEVTLTGRFKQIHAYTNSEVRTDDILVWQFDFDGNARGFFLMDDSNWIMVELDKVLYDYVIDTEREFKHLKIAGNIRTEVGRGTGITTNYIKVKRVEVLQEEENE